MREDFDLEPLRQKYDAYLHLWHSLHILSQTASVPQTTLVPQQHLSHLCLCRILFESSPTVAGIATIAAITMMSMIFIKFSYHLPPAKAQRQSLFKKPMWTATKRIPAEVLRPVGNSGGATPPSSPPDTQAAPQRTRTPFHTQSRISPVSVRAPSSLPQKPPRTGNTTA